MTDTIETQVSPTGCDGSPSSDTNSSHRRSRGTTYYNSIIIDYDSIVAVS